MFLKLFLRQEECPDQNVHRNFWAVWAPTSYVGEIRSNVTKWKKTGKQLKSSNRFWQFSHEVLFTKMSKLAQFITLIISKNIIS